MFSFASWPNRWAHQVVIGALKGASASWWNTRHFRHHAKPNVLGIDADIRAEPAFLVGSVVATRWAAAGKAYLPYHLQVRRDRGGPTREPLLRAGWERGCPIGLSRGRWAARSTTTGTCSGHRC